MRDNTLAAALLRQGRDVVLIPLYTPTRTDEENVSGDRVFFGGINVYLQAMSAVFRQLPRPMVRWLDSPRLLRFVARSGDMVSPEKLGPLTLAMLQGPSGPHRAELARLIRELDRIRPDLVHLPNAFFVGTAAAMKQALGVPVVCPLTGEDIFLDKLPEPFRNEAIRLIRQGARDVDAFVAVTRYYRSVSIESFGLPPAHVYHVPLGIRIDETLPSGRPGVDCVEATRRPPFTIGYLARICPDKGLHLLWEAVRLMLRDGRDCRIAAAGYLSEAQRPYLERIRADAARQGPPGCFEYLGAPDRAGKLRFLRSVDVLSVPTVYREAKGIYVLEAFSQGVPVVQPRHGSFPELIEETGGGVLFEPGDPHDLARSLGEMIDQPDLRRELGKRGQQAVRRSFSDEVMADATWAVFEACRDRHDSGIRAPEGCAVSSRSSAQK